jgi:hypothetical protein
MHVARATLPLALLVGAIALTACNPAPSRSEALEALREATPGLDTTTAFARVWQDGPPWFSCAEVIAKFATSTDSTFVRDQVGNWRPLVVSGWLVLRDTTRGVVSDPGWCSAKLTDEPARLAGGWVPVALDSFPTGSARRGWRVPVGKQRLVVVGSPRATERDVAVVDYATTVAPNANGAAMAADRDSAQAVAVLHRVDGRWQVASRAPRSGGLPEGDGASQERRQLVRRTDAGS